MIRARIAWLRDAPDRDPEVLAASLSAAEAVDLAGIVSPQQRRSFLLSRTLLRQVISDATGAAGPTLRFERARSGRLLLAAPAGWHISLSHAPGLVAVMVATAPCGVDIERVRPARVAAVARRYFAAAEVAALAAADTTMAQDDFFRLWTLKEASVKALGEGLAGNLARLAFDLSGDTPRPAFGTPAIRVWQAAVADAWLAAAVQGEAAVDWSVQEVGLAWPGA